MALILYVISTILILFLGPSNLDIIPFIWGISIGLGLIFSGELLYRQQNQVILRRGLDLLGMITIILGIVASILIEQIVAMFFFHSRSRHRKPAFPVPAPMP